jgi:hypothetical protein
VSEEQPRMHCSRNLSERLCAVLYRVVVWGVSEHTATCIGCAAAAHAEVYRDELVHIVLRLDDQYWLGRCIVAPIKHVSPLALYSAPYADTFARLGLCIDLLNAVYTHLFAMAYPNIAQLGNLTEDGEGKVTADMRWHHAHVHYIPRYEAPVHRYGVTFVVTVFLCVSLPAASDAALLACCFRTSSGPKHSISISQAAHANRWCSRVRSSSS